MNKKKEKKAHITINPLEIVFTIIVIILGFFILSAFVNSKVEDSFERFNSPYGHYGYRPSWIGPLDFQN